MQSHVAAPGTNISRLVILGILIALTLAADAFAADPSSACASNPANRELDYWLGNWKIGAPGSSANARSTVSLSLDKCLIVENWDGGRGHAGQNIFGYSADDKSWYGMFADNEGRVHVFTSGKVSSGSAEFEGTSRGPDGKKVLNRVRITRISPDNVEQVWEKSGDNGSTWNLAFRGEYLRTNP